MCVVCVYVWFGVCVSVCDICEYVCVCMCCGVYVVWYVCVSACACLFHSILMQF